MSQFWEKYKDPRWQRRRLEVMQNADFSCEGCGANDKPLNVHHKLYLRGHDPWEYNDLELMCLCEECHEQWHFQKRTFGVALQWIDLHAYTEVVGYAVGVAMRSCPPDVKATIRTSGGKVGSAKALGISLEDLERALDPSGGVFSGSLQELRSGALKRNKSRRGKK